MKLPEIRWLLNRKNILAEDRKLEYGYNRIRAHNRWESEEHFITKALLSFKIMKHKDKAILSEAEMRNGRSIDVLQVSRKSLVGYEIESSHNTKDDVEGVDFIEISLTKMPKKAKEGIKELSKWLNEFIV